MFLAIDIGNTNITFGLFEVKNGKTVLGPKKVWRMATLKGQTSNEYAAAFRDIDAESVKSIGIASVVPSLNPVFKDLVKKCFRKKAFFVNYINNGGLKLAVLKPKETGADRIANAAAAYSLFGGGTVIIDFGTATTFDCVDLKGRYTGGAIAPGPAISAQSLNLKTAQLPRVEMKKTRRAIGKNTVECMQSGLFFGYIGLIKELIARIKKEMKVNRIIATGGLASLMTSEIKEIKRVCPNLTLEGIRIIFERQGTASNDK